MIWETIVTTRNPDGSPNIAPMGPECPEDNFFESFELRPFTSSTTYKNLKRHPQGVVHICDDVLLFATAAVHGCTDGWKTTPATTVDVPCLVDCCQRIEFQTTWIQDNSNRTSIQCKALARQSVREFFGFNRARSTVIEASILASRVDFLPMEEITRKYSEYEVIVNKTGGPKENSAFRILNDFVRSTIKKDASVESHNE